MSSVLNNFLANLGFGTSDATKQAEGDTGAAVAAYNGLTPPSLTAENPDYASASQEGPTEMNGIAVNPADEGEQQAQMAALGNIASQGGRTAQFNQDLAQAQQAGNAAAEGQRGAVMQNAAARGMSGSGTELLGELAANQAAQTTQANADSAAAANAQNTALSAGQGAANIGGQMYNQDYTAQANKAGAQDAINRFNAQQNTGISEYNAGIGNQAQQYNTGLQQQEYGDQYQKASGVANANLGAANYYQNQANMGAQQAGNSLGGGVKMGAAALAAASGGEVPGDSAVPGDSTFNDFINAHSSAGGPNIKVSPHEVVVPVTMRQNANDHQIANFVRNPPKMKSTSGPSDKEAMLSALGNIRKRRMGMAV